MDLLAPGSPQARALRYVAARARGGPPPPGARLTVNFHPDRTVRGRLVVERLAEDGVYLSQFATGTGNGGLTAHPGGERWRWESRLFGGAYDRAAPRERPVYGALDHRRSPVGGAPRFGACHLLLAPATLAWATFCYPDSSAGPAAFGVADRCDTLVRLAGADGRDALDGHVEAQIHGPVRLDRDVTALVLDPSYRGTPVEDAARRLPCPVRWHGGFRLTVGELTRYPGYRGPAAVALGAAIAVGGVLDPRIIGDAARGGRHDPQTLKQVWHCLARFGAPGAGRG